MKESTNFEELISLHKLGHHHLHIWKITIIAENEMNSFDLHKGDFQGSVQVIYL
jgi:hypothetical protein